jgi:hypothetical protein
LTYPLGLPGPGSAGKDLLGASDVGGGAGQGVGDELGPVDRQRCAGVGIGFPLARTGLADGLIRQMGSFGQGGDRVVDHLVVGTGGGGVARSLIAGVE